MNIDEIRAEIPNTFGSWEDMEQWAYAHDKPFGDSKFNLLMRIAHWFVDKSFEAGKADAIVVPDNAAIAESWHEGYKIGFDDAARDPHAWYVLDKNGEQVHIGDTVIDCIDGTSRKVLGMFISASSDEMYLTCSGSVALRAKACEKEPHDSWGKVKDDLAAIILCAMESGDSYSGIDDEVSARLNADEFISRICNLAEVDKCK